MKKSTDYLKAPSFSPRQIIQKPVLHSPAGMVTSQAWRAATVGADILSAGGDCIDAAVAVSFALGVVEPWMSGMGGGGSMVLYRAKTQEYQVIDFGMRAPSGLKADHFPLTGKGTIGNLFPWPQVQDDRNVHGATAVAVPGNVRGIDLAHRQYGRMPWKELLQPAIDLADIGLAIDGSSALFIAGSALDLRRYPSSAATYLSDGLPPVPQWGIRSTAYLPQQKLKASLSHLASAGADDFYHGDLARSIAQDIAEQGGYLSFDDLQTTKAKAVAPLRIPYRDSQIYATPELTCGPTLARVLSGWSQWNPKSTQPDSEAFTQYAKEIQTAYQERLASMGDIDGLRSLGTEQRSASCTTHFCVADKQGNMVSVTQTLLSLFGSCLVLPQSGILMNNGLLWFDPVPGRPNSLSANKRCMSNYTPVIAEIKHPSAPNTLSRLALGASGGRRIMPAIAQILSFMIDYGMSLEEALHHPRIDASEGTIVITDQRLAPSIVQDLKQQFDTEMGMVQMFLGKFACPSAIYHTKEEYQGGTDPVAAWADAIAPSS